MYLPHQIVGQLLNKKFDEDIRRHYFRGMEFAAPVGDPAGSAQAAPCGTCIPTCTR